MITYIYGLLCPVANVIRYVGKTIHPKRRLRAHMLAAARHQYKHHTSRWLRLLIAQGLQPEFLILEQVPADCSWQEAERRWIAAAEDYGWDLTNSTFGGEGLDYRDPIQKAAYQAKISARMKELWNRPERKKEASQRSLKAWADPDARAARLESFKRTYDDPKRAARNLEVLAEIAARPEVKAKKSAASKANYEGSAFAKFKETEAFRIDQGARLAERWTDAEQRAKMQEARWTVDQRDQQRDRLAQRQDKIKASLTPEVIAKRNAAIKASWAKRKANKDSESCA